MNDHTRSPLAGTRAPDFALPRSLHETVSLQDVRGHTAILAFYPGDWEPVSCQQLVLYQEYLPEFHRFHADLIGISVDTVWSHIALGRELGLTFPLLSDFHPKGYVSRAYDVYREEESWSGRALFVLDADETVHWSRRYPTNLNPGVHSILIALETLQHQQMTR
ncbi:MAG TPA: redoxin domain-containing protein [Chloroflexota bacterium]